MTPILELARVSKSYGALRPLRIDRLDVNAGEAVALVGLDGPAAEVLINLVMGAVLPDAGRVAAFGRETAAITASDDWLALADRFGLVGERTVLLEPLSVVQNLSLPFTLDVEPPPAGIRERAVDLGRLVGLPDASWDALVSTLDAAARLRLRFARALAHGPDILVLEHAAASVDRSQRAELGRLVRTVASARGTAILALTSDDEFAGAVAGRVLRHDPRTGACEPPPRGWRLWRRR